MISVIVPVYNVESCLGKCLDSILEQTYRDFELLLIDDGATDSSGDICERYAKTDERIKVFHKPNGGLSDARNYGIERASGDYLTFIDSDDYIIANYLEVLYKMATENNAEMLNINFILTNGNMPKKDIQKFFNELKNRTSPFYLPHNQKVTYF